MWRQKIVAAIPYNSATGFRVNTVSFSLKLINCHFLSVTKQGTCCTRAISSRVCQAGDHSARVRAPQYDVVDTYHKKNRKPKIPEASSLNAIANSKKGRQGPQVVMEESEECEESDLEDERGRRRAQRNSKGTKKREFTQLQNYPVMWKKVLEEDCTPRWVSRGCIQQSNSWVAVRRGQPH